ncbi:MAG TPA: arginase family protein, partial [Herpetosiphonaceae bacterium]
GDCSILLGNALALKRLGRYGLVYLDAHDDFRHLGNAPAIGAAAGEDLALVTGRGDPRLTALGGGALIDPADIAVLGVRPESTELDELRELGMLVSTSKDLAAGGIEAGAAAALARVTANTAGFWIHLDWDVIDGAALPAVDCPEPGGLSFDELAALLRPLLASPRCAGLELTIYDPDLDPSGAGAAAIVACLARAFGR